MKTYSFEGGKYEFDQDELGLILAARRNGEPWRAGMESFAHSKCFGAMLNRIDELEADSSRLDFLEKSCLVEGSMRQKNSLQFSTVKTWAVASHDCSLRDTLDIIEKSYAEKANG